MIAMLRRRLMGGRGAFEFTYTGQFTDKIEGSNRVIKFTSSGTLNVSGSVVAVLYLLAGGGGAQYDTGYENVMSGGGGGNLTVNDFMLSDGTYNLVIGKGGGGCVGKYTNGKCSGDGGDTTGFGYTCTGGTGGGENLYTPYGGTGGKPNGGNGSTHGKGVVLPVAGGKPNGGSVSSSIQANSGGDGYITLTIPICAMIPLQFALRRRMMMAGGGGAPISDLPLGALINVGTDGGAGTPNYEIADKDNLVSGGVVLVRKNVYSLSKFGSTVSYPNSTLDNLITTTIYNQMPSKLRDIMMDVSFPLYSYLLSDSENIIRKMFTLTRMMVGFGAIEGVKEGKTLQLYTSEDSRKKTFEGGTCSWWLCSQDSKFDVMYVTAFGGSVEQSPSHDSGVVPAFVIPSETLYSVISNTDGSYNLIL